MSINTSYSVSSNSVRSTLNRFEDLVVGDLVELIADAPDKRYIGYWFLVTYDNRIVCLNEPTLAWSRGSSPGGVVRRIRPGEVVRLTGE